MNPLYLVFSKVNQYFEEINKNQYLTLVPTNESEEIVTKYEELWSKIWYSIKLITKSSDDYNEKYMKIKSYSDDNLSLNKTIEIPSMIAVVRVVFHENYWPQVFLDLTKCKNWMSLFINDSMNLSDIAYLNIKNAGYCCIISGINKNEAINLMQNVDLIEKSGTW